MTTHKKFYLAITLILIIFIVITFSQIKKAQTITTKTNPVPLVSTATFDIPIDGTDQTMGNPGADITIVEFSDLGCKYCQTNHFIISQFVNAHPKEARLVWKDAPFSGFILKGNAEAHIAAYCAGKQKKFWQFVEMTMQNKAVNTSGLEKTAIALKLNLTNWKNCLSSAEADKKINESLALAEKLEIKSTPTIFINNKKINLTDDLDLNEVLNGLLENK